MRSFLRVLVALLLVSATLWLASQVSPRPTIAVIQWLFDRGAAKTSEALEAHVPEGVQTLASQPFRSGQTVLSFDLHRSAAAGTRALPLIVWIHGGGFVSGRKEDVSAYARLVAARGFAVASLDYTLAPDAVYPTQLRELNDALAHLVREAPKLGIDPQRVLLAGDSAGAQLALNSLR